MPIKVPTFSFGACSNIRENINGRPIPSAIPCRRRPLKSIVKLLVNPAIIVPIKKEITATLNKAIARYLLRKNDPKGMMIVETSIYPVVSHCTVFAETANCFINCGKAIFSAVSITIPKKLSTPTAIIAPTSFLLFVINFPSLALNFDSSRILSQYIVVLNSRSFINK